MAAFALMALSAPPASALPAGKPDRTYQANGNVHDIAYSGNVAYFVGSFTAVMPPGSSATTPRNRAAAINVSTGQLLSWNPNVNGTVYAVEASGSKVYLGGSFSSVSGMARKNVAQVDAGTGRPTSWNATPSALLRSMVVSKDGSKVYIGGQFTKVNGQARLRLAALSASNGALIAGFAPRVEQIYAPPINNTCRPRCPANVTALDLSPDGSRVYLGGTFGLVNGASRNSAAAVTASAGATLSWNPNVWSDKSFNQVWDIAPYGSRVLLCGNFYAVGGRRHPNMASVNTTDGKPVARFVASTDGAIPDCEAATSSAHPYPRLYVGGHFGKACGCEFAKDGGVYRMHLAAFNGTTGELLSWSPGANSAHGVYAMDLTSSKLAIGGEFTVTGGTQQAHFAQYSGSP